MADDIGRETMTPVGVTVAPVVGDTFNDIVIGCDKPGNDTWNEQYILYYCFVILINLDLYRFV